MKLANTDDPSPEALRAATVLITGGKNEDECDRGPFNGCEAYLSLNDIDGDCLFSDTSVPKFDGMEEYLAEVRRKVAIVIDKYMNERK